MESETRNADQITSKLRDIRLKCIEFGGIYNNLLNIRKSGLHDFDVFKAAMEQFEKTTSTRKAFPYMKPTAKKAASIFSNSSVMDMFDDKFDRYVQLQETKAEVMTRM
uniref:Uncharacterized protein n=1 Tax=Lactuca sativa TaxID=4236 RepID=A0A9R1WMX8_LACSA|nr:hypothetical protein LSAT_V11C100013170 [Lactuca sativa]